MAKRVYKIPDSLDKSFADMEIAIRSDGGVGVKPLPIKIVLAYILSILMLFCVTTQTFIADGHPALVVLFVLLWLIMTVMLLKRNGTGELNANLVLAMVNYLAPSSRKVITRSMSPASEFLSVCGIESIDESRGMLNFTDGTVGYMYSVVGSGSILLFESDRDAILDRVDSFYRKIREDCELIYITTKESQSVYRQVLALKKRYDALDGAEPDLYALADTEFRYLKDYVGGSFRSIHQYLVLKANNPEALLIARNVLEGEVESSSLVFKRCTALYGEDIKNVLRIIYQGKESV